MKMIHLVLGLSQNIIGYRKMIHLVLGLSQNDPSGTRSITWSTAKYHLELNHCTILNVNDITHDIKSERCGNSASPNI